MSKKFKFSFRKMSKIPGLNICDDESGAGIQIYGFEGTSIIPDSHKYGNCRRVSEFGIMTKISEGWFGTIFKCREKQTKQLYTLKKYKIDLKEGVPSYVIRERSLLNKLLHVNIIKCYGVVAGKELDSNYILLEYCPISLNDLIEKKTQFKFVVHEISVVKYIVKQLFEGLKFIHKALIIHRDISDSNILFTEGGVLKITGFHASRFSSKGDMTPGFSLFLFQAPELLFSTKKYGSAIDMWSAACVLGKLLLKRPLFEGKTGLDVLHSISIALGTPSEEIWPGYTELCPGMKHKSVYPEEKPNHTLKSLFSEQPLSCQNLMKNLLMYYPNARLSAEDCLKSSYFTEAPSACTCAKFVSILKSVLPPGTQEKMEH